LSLHYSRSLLMDSRPAGPTLFPYTTLFRSSEVKKTIRDVSPEIAVGFTALKAQILERLLPERLMAMLAGFFGFLAAVLATVGLRSEEHTSELQSLRHIVCRLLLEKKK